MTVKKHGAVQCAGAATTPARRTTGNHAIGPAPRRDFPADDEVGDGSAAGLLRSGIVAEKIFHVRVIAHAARQDIGSLIGHRLAEPGPIREFQRSAPPA